MVTDVSGNVISQHHYMPFGEEIPFVAQGTTNKRQFTGHERDAESGLDYMLARYYSSSLARFMAVDPGNDTRLENPQSWNKYTYVRNNPIAYVDPYGMNSMPRPYNVPPWKWKDPCAGRVMCAETGDSGGQGSPGDDGGGDDPTEGFAPPGSYVESITVTAAPDEEPSPSPAMGGFNRLDRSPPPPKGGPPRVTPYSPLPEEPYPAPGTNELMKQRGIGYQLWQLLGRGLYWLRGGGPLVGPIIVFPNPCFANPAGPGCGGSPDTPSGGA